MRESPEQLVDTVKGLKTEKHAGISKRDEEVLLINGETLKKLASDRRGNAQTAAVAEISEEVKTINDLTHHNSGVEIKQMGTNKAADPIRALSERLITTYEVVVTEKEAKYDKSSTPVTEVGGEMNNHTVTKFRELEMDKNTIYNSANNTVTKFRELEMDKNTIYNSTAASMSEFSEVTSTAEDLKCKDKPKPSLRTWDQTLNDVETMLVYSVYFRRKEQQTFQKEEQKQTFFLSILLGRNCSGRGRLA
jgi:cell pole-organizing protein PopZ